MRPEYFENFMEITLLSSALLMLASPTPVKVTSSRKADNFESTGGSLFSDLYGRSYYSRYFEN